MNLAPDETEFPVRLRFERPVSDETFLRLSLDNDPFRVERDSNGELLVMTTCIKMADSWSLAP
jgi:Uma2 family endonuclease